MAITASSEPGEYVVFAQLLAELYHSTNQECIAEKIFHIRGGDRVTYTHLNDDGDEIVFEIDWKQVKQCIAALQNVWFDDRAIHMKGTYGMGSTFGERKFSSWLHPVEYSGKTLTIKTGPQAPESCRVRQDDHPFQLLYHPFRLQKTTEQMHRPKAHDLAARSLIDFTPPLQRDGSHIIISSA